MPPPTCRSKPMPTPPQTCNAPVFVEVAFVVFVIVVIPVIIPPVNIPPAPALPVYPTDPT